MHSTLVVAILTQCLSVCSVLLSENKMKSDSLSCPVLSSVLLCAAPSLYLSEQHNSPGSRTGRTGQSALLGASQSASVTLAGVENSELTDMGAALSSVPLCSRMAGDGVDNNNNLESEPDNNLTSQEVVQTQPAPVQTSTPKLEREREPAEDSLDFGPGSDRTTFGSDSGLEHSGDELELSRYVLEDELDDVIDTEEEEEEEEEDGGEEETSESLESGDLGVDRSTTFRVKKKEEEEEAGKDSDSVLRKLDDLQSVAVTSRLSELSLGDFQQLR